MEKLNKYFAETMRAFGVGLMVASFVLKLSKEIDEKTLLTLLLFGLFTVLSGAILYLYGEE
ncbi:hypothetical protein [Aquifex sp.]